MEQYVMRYQKKLRCGITTGTCATAAAAAAAAHLLCRKPQNSITVHTPKGITIEVQAALSCQNEEKAEYKVIKDSGDDPDVTAGIEIYASVERMQKDSVPPTSVFRDERYPNLFLDGAEGIGRVTKEGLEQRPGQAAINAVPRQMIFQAVGEIAGLAGCMEPLMITLRIPKGRELAARTFNPRLGIEGGLSVLGTSGILEPMSEKAIIDTIEAEIRQLNAQGRKALLVTPGNYGQGYVADYLRFEAEYAIKCSNYVGDTLDLAIAYGFEDFLLAGNIGKLVKLAAGIMNTHSRVADGRCETFAAHTALCGGEQWQIEKIMNSITTEEILLYLENWNLRQKVMDSICRKIQQCLLHRTGGSIRAGVVVFSEKFGYLGETEEAGEIIQRIRKGK